MLNELRTLHLSLASSGDCSKLTGTAGEHRGRAHRQTCWFPTTGLLDNFARSTSKSAELHVKWATQMPRYLARLAAIRLEQRRVKDGTYKRREPPTRTSLNWPHRSA